MRKDFIARKGLKSLVYAEYEVSGLNLSRLIDVYRKRGIDLFDIKKRGNRQIRITVKHSDSKKLFAITKEMCYNIKRVRFRGKFKSLTYLYRNVGVLLGALVFIATSFFTNDLVFSIDYSGSGSVYKREVNAYLKENGVGVYSRFSDVDLDALGEGIMAISSRLSFAECRKEGNRLKIELILSKEPPKTLSGGERFLKTDVDGVIETLKVYRGTPLVKVGDGVHSGDVLVDGFYLVGEERVEENVIASATVLTKRVYDYLSESDNEEDVALLFAEQALNILEPAFSEVVKTSTGKGFNYRVTLTARKVLFAG